MALKETFKEAIYLSGMLQWLNEQLGDSSPSIAPCIIPVLADSESAIKLAENPEFHKRTKHIDIIYHFIRECIRDEKVKLAFVRTSEQLADGFTKGLNKNKHDLFIEGLNL